MQEINAKQEIGALSSTVKPVREPPTLIVLCGPSHVGKTTLARRFGELGENFTIISPDEIRKQLSVRFQDSRYESRVWDIYESMKCKALKAGRNVVLDACHISKRARWHALKGPNSNYKKICVVFDLPWQTIRERCLSEKRVSLKEVRRMWQAFQHSKPSPEELKLQGFDAVCFMTVEGGCHDNSRQGCFIFHHLRAGLSAWPEGQWYKDKEVNYG
jgi:predicted kinase